MQFLIQSDFVTQASREDVFHSARNKVLLSTVAETFRDAVLYFCTHPTLQYQWMRYLPLEVISDEFWTELRPKVISLMEKTPCIRSWSGSWNRLYLPTQLQHLGNSNKDKNGEPLFADMNPEVYMSPHYTELDFMSLKSIGSTSLSYTTFLSFHSRGRPPKKSF